MFVVPDLNYHDALSFCEELNSYEPVSMDETFEFDFSKVKKCDPFPMLIVSSAIRNKRKKYQEHKFRAQNCDNKYAEYMKFYKACGLDRGGSVEISKGSLSHKCITKLSIDDLYSESLKNLDNIQETMERKAKSMASVLSQGNTGFQDWLTFVVRELLRNIPEHSKSKEIWYCVQYWPSYDLVELSILDEGIGIRNSLDDSREFRSMYNNDYEAIKLALEPGVSGTFSSSRRSIGTGDWENSGYGLYMVSQMCAELGASFIIGSGSSAVEIAKNDGAIMGTAYSTYINGTAIQIRMRPSKNCDYEKIKRDIIVHGEKIAKSKEYAIHSASKASRGFIV